MVNAVTDDRVRRHMCGVLGYFRLTKPSAAGELVEVVARVDGEVDLVRVVGSCWVVHEAGVE